VTTLAQLRTGLADNLATIKGVQVSPYALAQPIPPGIQILPGEVDFRGAFARGFDLWRFQVQAYVAYSADTGSQVLLDELLNPTGARSVKTALESDPTLGGVAFGVFVPTASGYRLVDRADGSQMILVDFSVEVSVEN
jgi:hypothetical protein